MNSNGKLDQLDTLDEFGATDAVFAQALADFRASVTAWSEAESGRTQRVSAMARRPPLRLAAGWALAVALVVGSVVCGKMANGVYVRHRLAEMGRNAAAGQRRQATEPQARVRNVEQDSQPDRADDEDALLAKVDSDVSRQVPSAMDPLAQLMTMDDGK